MAKKSIVLCFLTGVLVYACSSNCLAQSPPPESEVQSENANNDPFEGANRFIFGANRAIDSVALKPLAEIYRGVFPKYARQRVTHFYSNLGEVRNFFNNILQGNAKGSGHNIARLVVNSTVGILGFYDPAGNYFEITPNEQHFADTLEKYEVPLGPYLVVPLIGPSTVRNLPAFAVDLVLYPLAWIGSDGLRNSLIVVRFVELRESYLTEEQIISALGVDLYEATKSYYLNQYQTDENNGNLQEYEDLDDLPASMGGTMPHLVDSGYSKPTMGR